jgi:hypothetical protein
MVRVWFIRLLLVNFSVAKSKFYGGRAVQPAKPTTNPMNALRVLLANLFSTNHDSEPEHLLDFDHRLHF